MSSLICKSCSQVFNENTRAPMMLRCTHIICLECLNEAKEQSENPNKFNCPINNSDQIDKNA